MLDVVIACVAASAIAHAQQPPSPPASANFEVASVKQNISGDRRQVVLPQPGGKITFTNIPALQLIVMAYQLTPLQLVGGPGWLETDHFDIVAKLEREPEPRTSGPNPQMLALRSLLADRFKLKLHNQTRELDVYNLVMLKPGAPGPAMTRSKADCAASQCGASTVGGVVRATGVPTASIAQLLTNQTGRVVYDRTNLAGGWDFTFKLSDADPDAPSVFTVIQEQFGMKRESAKAPVEVTVIDSVEHPTDD